MPSMQERPPKKIERLEMDGAAPQPAAQSGGFPAPSGPRTAAGTSAAAQLMTHWTDDSAPASAEEDSLVAPGAGAAGANPLAGKRLYVDPNTSAKRQANAWRASRPDDAAQMDKIGNSPQSTWLGGWNQNVQGDVHKKVAAAQAQGTVPVFVAYNIPNRDVGQYSAGGANDAAKYHAWVQQVAEGVKGGQAVVILEPDALAQADQLPPAQREARYAMMRDAVATLKGAGATVYLDAGNPGWKQPADMAQRLNQAGVAGADGFSLNVSNFQTDAANVAYGTALSQLTGGKHFVVDTSRNGLGPAADKEWCNPAGRALGQHPTTQTGNPLIDAYLWVKNPGESDGNKNGAPAAGTFWPEYALGLAQREPAHGAAAAAHPTSAAPHAPSPTVPMPPMPTAPTAAAPATSGRSLADRIRLSPVPPPGQQHE